MITEFTWTLTLSNCGPQNTVPYCYWYSRLCTKHFASRSLFRYTASENRLLLWFPSPKAGRHGYRNFEAHINNRFRAPLSLPSTETESGIFNATFIAHFECSRWPCEDGSPTTSTYQLGCTLILYLSLQYKVYQHVTDPIQLSVM
jgi:hypothetical protein